MAGRAFEARDVPKRTRLAARRAGSARRTTIVAVAVVAATVLAPALWGGVVPGTRVAEAAVVYELVPSASLGVTNNALLTEVPVRDEFTVLTVDGRLNADLAHADYALSNRLSYTHFFEQHGADIETEVLSGAAIFHLNAKLDLRFSAGARLSRTSQVAIGDLSVVSAQGTPAGSNLYLATTVGEDLNYMPSAQLRYGQSLTFSQVNFIGGTAGLPTSRSIAGFVHGDLLRPRDTYTLIAGLTDFSSSSPPGMNTGSQFLVAQLTAGWQRALSAVWSTDLQAGFLTAFNSGSAGYGVVGLAAVSYRRGLWFATASVSQSQVPNLFIGQMTITDQAQARLALPLGKRELVTVAGFASYIYARPGDLTSFERLYDQQAAGAVLSAHLARHPFWGALEYTFLDQHGNAALPQPAPNLLRHTALVSVGGSFAFGPGTPRLFHGGI